MPDRGFNQLTARTRLQGRNASEVWTSLPDRPSAEALQDQQVERGLSITDQEGDHVIDEDIFACTPVASITTTKIR